MSDDNEHDTGQAIAQHYLMDSASLLRNAELEPRWLVPGAIPVESIVYLIGKPGSSKSWCAYDLTLAASQNRCWLGFPQPKVVGSPLSHIYNYDNPGRELARRYMRLGLTDRDAMGFHSLGAHEPPDGFPPILRLPDAFDAIMLMTQALQPDIIVIDSLRQSHTSDENDNQEMAIITSQLRLLANTGAAVIVIHHLSRSGNLRGATEIEASADAIIEIGQGTANWVKTRGWQMSDPVVPFTLTDVGDTTILQPGPQLSAILANGPLGRRDIMDQFGLTKASLEVMVKAALEADDPKLTEVRQDGRGGTVLEWKS